MAARLSRDHARPLSLYILSSSVCSCKFKKSLPGINVHERRRNTVESQPRLQDHVFSFLEANKILPEKKFWKTKTRCMVAILENGWYYSLQTIISRKIASPCSLMAFGVSALMPLRLIGVVRMHLPKLRHRRILIESKRGRLRLSNC